MSLSSAAASPLGTSSTATAAENHLAAADGTDADETTTDETADDSTTDRSADDVGEVEGTDPESSTEDTTESLSGAFMLGQAHAAAMKIWANCVGDAASGPKTMGQPMPPKTACGTKPLGPGQLMHQASTTTVPVPTTSDSTEPSDTSTDTESTDTGSSEAKPEYDAPHADDSTTEHSGDSSWSEDHSDSTEDSGDQESGQTASSDHESGHDD